jgi:hypothetical protein
MCVFFSGGEPESLRGPQAEMVIVDEIARVRAMLSAPEVSPKSNVLLAFPVQAAVFGFP